MLHGCRPAGRLFYLVLAIVSLVIDTGLEGFAAAPRKSPSSVAAKPVVDPTPRAASPAASPQSGPAMTSVVDSVYTANGGPAAGTLVITWPAFTTSGGTAVAPGELDVMLGANGALDVQLIPNANATPPNVYYSVVYQLQPNEVRTEYWIVPTTSPATLAEVRTTPGSGTAAQPVSMQYVNTALAAKANDNAVVHLANTETITGTKSFAAPPNVPNPVGAGDVANKSYVDSAVGNVGAGNFLPTAGGTMTGPLTLNGSPTAPLQAAAKQYVDESATAKADLVSGLVPTSELGSGTASSLNCLLGSGAWGPCGSSANATAIQSVPVAASAPANGQVLTYSSSSGQYAPATPSGASGGVVTGPGASQNITQPVGTQMSVNDLSGIRYVTGTDNWSVTPSGSLIGGTQATLTLTPCPVGIDSSGNSMYYVYISGQGTPEVAMVTGGTCTGGAASGTIVFTPKNTHSATYVLSSASSGIQEAINDACGVPNGSGGNPNARVVLPATGSIGLAVYGSIFGHCSRTLIEGNGTLLSCSTRDRCIVLGDLTNSNDYGGVTLRGVNLTSTVNSDGCQIKNTVRQSNVVTITVASGCSTIQTGDLVNINFTDSPSYWGSHGPVTVSGTSITYLFTGYVTGAPQYEYLGWKEQGPVYRYNLVAQSDEVLLNRKALPNRAPFVDRSAGNAVSQLAQDLLPGWFDRSAVQNLDAMANYVVNPQKSFSFHAAEIAVCARASFRAMNGSLILAPVGATTYALNESDENFSPEGLRLNNPNMPVNEVTVIGLDEPQAYVRDYFVGNGESLKFYLSQKPFAQAKPALIDEEYLGPGLDPTTWVVNDPSRVVSVVAQTLQIAGGTGIDGQTTVSFIEQVELGGALELQHGDVSFTASSQGVLGGLYAGAISEAGCLAGFQIVPSGANSTIQALINGAPSGAPMTTTPGHQYFFTTYLYSMEVYRRGETYHSSVRAAGNGWGGASIAADIRVVLEVQDIDPSNPETLVAPATVLFDDVVTNAPGFCTYALVNSINMQCSIAYTYTAHISLAEVRTAVQISPTEYAPYITQLVGALTDGAECEITSDPSLDFYPEYVPALNQLIVASYRGSGRAVAQIQNATSVASLQNGADDGTRGSVRVAKTPEARTDVDCENVSLAILDDSTGTAWSGTYETWSDFLPGAAEDIFPGDAIAVNAPTRGAAFTAAVREVEIQVADPADDRGFYTIVFANDLAVPLGIEFGNSAVTVELQDTITPQTTSQVGEYYQTDLTEAQVTSVSSTTVNVDSGMAPPSGGGIEVRENDYGWGQANDRNLFGRFGTQTFSLNRLAAVQDYFLRLYDDSSPPRYSRYSAALHVDYPL